MTGVLLADGRLVPRTGGFVRPHWKPSMEYVRALGLDTYEEGLIPVGDASQTSIGGIYAAGDMSPPGPQQLIVAAAIDRDLIGQGVPASRRRFWRRRFGALK